MFPISLVSGNALLLRSLSVFGCQVALYCQGRLLGRDALAFAPLARDSFLCRFSLGPLMLRKDLLGSTLFSLLL